MKKKLVTYFQQTDPSPSRTIAAGYNVGQEWYNTVTGDKFYHKTDGVWAKYENTSSPAITQVTYAELVSLIGSSSLVPDRTYLLTDYETVYEQPVSNDIISSGVIEPLYITATDVNKLSNECKSELYPNDIVYYEVTGDIGNGWATEGFTKGKIYRRIDTLGNNDIGTDWRHIKYRRWAMKVENPWTVGNSYVIGDIVDNSGEIYICINDIIDSQSLGDDNWFLYPAINGEYAGMSPSGSLFNVLGNNITINVDSVDFQDNYMFSVLDFSDTEAFTNNKIETYQLNNNSILSTFFTENKIGGRFIDNHIKASQFNSNDLSYAFYYNIFGIGGDFYYNNINTSFVKNIINAEFMRNDISEGYDVYANIFNGDFYHNVMSTMLFNYVNGFVDNTITGTFRQNAFTGGFNYNTCTTGYIEFNKGFRDPINSNSSAIGRNVFNSYFRYNTMYGDFNNNRVTGLADVNIINHSFENNDIIGDNFINNNIGTNFTDNKIGGGFEDNIVGNYFQYNNIGTGIHYWTFRNNTNHLTMLNEISGTGHNIPYIPGTYDKTIRLSNGVLKCDYVDEYSDIIFQEDNTGPTFTFKSDREDLYLYAENKTFPVSGITAVTPFIIDWGDVVNPLVEDLAADTYFGPILHTYSGKLNTDAVEVVVIGEYIIALSMSGGNQITEFELNANTSLYMQSLNLSGNLLTNFNPSIALPGSLNTLVLANNLLTSFDPSIALPSGLQYLYLQDNLLTGFNPSIALPGALTTLYLQSNQLTGFDPSIALPVALIELDLHNNQITSFDPSIALPGALTTLDLQDNLLTSFNPVNHLLPSSLITLDLRGNQLDTTEVNNTLILLNTTYTTSSYKNFDLRMIPAATPDGAGLTALSALLAKGYSVNTD